MAEKLSSIMAAVATLNCDMPNALSNSWAVNQMTNTTCSDASVLRLIANHRNKARARCHMATPAQRDGMTANGIMMRLKMGP